MLIESETVPDRKPRAPAFTAARHIRGGFLAKLRDEVGALRAMGLDHVAIDRALGIPEEDARTLCPSVRGKVLRQHLPRRAINALLHGRHADIGGKTLGKRAKHLVEIASAYTPDELLCESGVGQATMMKIQLWLEERGASSRSSF